MSFKYIKHMQNRQIEFFTYIFSDITIILQNSHGIAHMDKKNPTQKNPINEERINSLLTF